MKRALLLWLLLWVGFPFVAFSQFSAAYDSLAKALLKAEMPADKVSVLVALSEELEGAHPDESIRYARDAYKLAEEHDLEPESVKALIQLANSYIRISDYKQAFEFAEKANDLAKELDLDDYYARSIGVIGLIYHELGDFENSAKYDFEYLKYYEGIKDERQIGLAYGNIGIDFISQDNYQKGLEYLKKSFDMAEKLGDFDGMAYQFNNIAGVYSEYFHDYRMALSYYKEALKINVRLKDQRQEGIYLMNIGNCYANLNVNDSVMMFYSRANAIFSSLNNPMLYAECQSLMADYHLKTGNMRQSRLHADTALKVSMENDFKEQVRTAAGMLHKVCLSINDTLSAYRYAMIENSAKDSLVEMQNRQEVYKLEFQYNFEKQDKVKQIARQRRETMMIVIMGSLLSGLVILFLLFSRHRIKAKNVTLEKESIEKELGFKNKELTINLISLIKKNEMLSDISNKLVTIGGAARNEETKDAINKISREVRLSADDKMLKEFSLRFQDVHAGFYEALLKKYPDLTQNELKLCAFLRLNMSSKDISELTGQRILTIDHARYRLRKKLGISNVEVNLVTFLSQI